MKKLLTVTLIVLLSVCLLWGCGDKTGADDAGEAPALYYNMSANTTVEADANGVYTLDFILNAEKKSFQVTDKALLDALLTQEYVGLTLDGNTITGFTRIHKMPYQRLAWNYYVLSVGGKAVKLNALASFAGKELLVELPDNFPVYDVTPQATEFGSITKLQKNDCVSIIADMDGNMLYAYVQSRPAAPHEGKLYCQHCESEVSWLDWLSTSTLPSTAGHYLLTDNVVMATSTTVSGGQICLDMNGKTVTQSTEGQRIYSIMGPATVTLMDSVGGSTFYPATATDRSPTKTGMVVYVDNFDAVLNMYNITLDASQITALYGHGVAIADGTFNMYDGTILGGTSFGPGSTAISANGHFNMYGGKIVGGQCITTQYVNPIGGAAVRVLGYTTIYDGIIEGGETYVDGGVLRVSPDIYGDAKLTMKGGTITGGKANRGSGIYVVSLGDVVLSGNVNVTGNDGDNIYLQDGATITIAEEGLGDDAKIGITMEKPGKFIKEAPEGLDASKYFVSDDSSKRVTADGSLK